LGVCVADEQIQELDGREVGVLAKWLGEVEMLIDVRKRAPFRPAAARRKC
jgi:hypothetical protein